MPVWVVRARRAGLAGVGAVSVLTAVLMIWLLIRPETIGSVRTGHLALVLALVLLPGAAFWAWRLERRVADREGARDGTAARPHAPRQASGRRHRRRVGVERAAVRG